MRQKREKYATQVIRDLKEGDDTFTGQGFELVVKNESCQELFCFRLTAPMCISPSGRGEMARGNALGFTPQESGQMQPAAEHGRR
jgi:hypothetical protein